MLFFDLTVLEKKNPKLFVFFFGEIAVRYETDLMTLQGFFFRPGQLGILAPSFLNFVTIFSQSNDEKKSVWLGQIVFANHDL